MDYDFMDPDAQQMFQELLDMLKSQMAQNVSQDMRDQMQEHDPRADGGHASNDAGPQPNAPGTAWRAVIPISKASCRKWGPMFGDDPPQSLDELMERIQQQMAQMQSLMDSLSPDMRENLKTQCSRPWTLASWMKCQSSPA